MADRPPTPPPLTVVAFLFLLLGLGGVVGTIVHLSNGWFHIDLDLLGIPIFFGLRRFSRGWRTCALVFLWIGLIGLPFGGILSLLEDTPANAQLFGWHFTNVRSLYVAIFCIALFPVVFWQYRVLARPDVRDLFHVSPQ